MKGKSWRLIFLKVISIFGIMLARERIRGTKMESKSKLDENI